VDILEVIINLGRLCLPFIFAKKSIAILLIWHYNRGTVGTVGTKGAELVQINGKESVYEQIINHYRKYISLGILKPLEKMPSVRELAIEIGVNHKTVERAYAELMKEGLIESIPKKGYFVSGEKKKNPMIKDVLKNLLNQGVTKEEILEELDALLKEDLK
jgi:DNA-binding transcriptional regulator YhcF (GntR family)